ncbi:MAG: HAMP domain-containing histidine kinase [Anaerolineae bacterium]|nr:HAMP domain-containing histidine kinase [Anaerolineae bacterium]
MRIRLRLKLTYSAILVLVLLLFSLTVISVLQWALFDSIDTTLKETATGIIGNIRGQFGLAFDALFDLPTPAPYPNSGYTLPDSGQEDAQPFVMPQLRPSVIFYPPDLDTFRASNLFVQIWNDQRELVSSSDNLGIYQAPMDVSALDSTEATLREVNAGQTPLRVFTQPIYASGVLLGHLQVAMSLANAQEAQNRVLLAMLAVGVIGLLVSLVVGEGLLERALRPIDGIAEAASQIATGDDLSRRIPYSGPQDELGQLVTVFNATLENLERLFMMQRRFVADVSHELRTPLTVIQTNLDLIKRYGIDEDSVRAIASESKRMTRLVGDLLLLAQADAGELTTIKQNLEIDTLLLDIFDQATTLAGEKLTVKLGRFEPVRVYGDQDRLKQLLLNLVSNAINHTPEGGTLTLSVWPEGRQALVTVADTGEGIPAEDLPHIFDRFYRVDKARARKGGGTGLGLSIAQWIAEAHGGFITVESAIGSGTTFTVSLPNLLTPPEALAETRPAIRLPRSLRTRPEHPEPNGGMSNTP